MAKRACRREIPTELNLQRFEEFILPHLTVGRRGRRNCPSIRLQSHIETIQPRLTVLHGPGSNATQSGPVKDPIGFSRTSRTRSAVPRDGRLLLSDGSRQQDRCASITVALTNARGDLPYRRHDLYRPEIHCRLFSLIPAQQIAALPEFDSGFWKIPLFQYVAGSREGLSTTSPQR